MVEMDHPKIGIGVLVFKDQKVLLGKRKGSHGAGEYAGVGGTLLYMEGLEECAHREAREEAGIEIDGLVFQMAESIKVWAPKHFVLIGYTAQWKRREPRVMEPHKVESWQWYNPFDPPQPLFESTRMQIENYLQSLRV